MPVVAKDEFGADTSYLAGGASRLDVAEIGEKTEQSGQALGQDRVFRAFGFQFEQIENLATSSQQPTAVLTVVGYGQMTWNRRSALYTYTNKGGANPGTVTVTSSLGGSATASVTVK